MKIGEWMWMAFLWAVIIALVLSPILFLKGY